MVRTGSGRDPVYFTQVYEEVSPKIRATMCLTPLVISGIFGSLKLPYSKGDYFRTSTPGPVMRLGYVSKGQLHVLHVDTRGLTRESFAYFVILFSYFDP